MHAGKGSIPDRINREFLVGLNDYARWDTDSEKQPVFDYYAVSEVERIGVLPKGMEGRELPATKYIVFCFRGIKEDSMQPVADYIYREWFPQSTCRLNENARYDLCGMERKRMRMVRAGLSTGFRFYKLHLRMYQLSRSLQKAGTAP